MTDHLSQSVSSLERDIRESWSHVTSASPEEWTPANPALGQCAVTALVVQDALGGDLLRATVNGTSHYWNRLPSGEELDLTLEQFGSGASPDGEAVVRGREYVLSFPDTAERYGILSGMVGTQPEPSDV